MAEPYITAHKCSSRHRAQIEQSEQCGCFHCLTVFTPNAIEEWIDDDDTAMCPRCGIDSVIGSASGNPIEREFLARMRAHWFGSAEPDEYNCAGAATRHFSRRA